MRQIADAERIRKFIAALGAEATGNLRVYITEGATAVLYGWRDSTIDVDVKFVPETDQVLRAIPQLKDSLRINVELASPADFIPELPGWQERSPFIAREGKAPFHHYDLHAQALAKIERGHDQDIRDAREMVRRGLVETARLMRFFEEVEPNLYRYPAIDPASFRHAVEGFVRETA